MKKYWLSLFLGIGFCILSCEKDLDYDLPQDDPKLSVFGYFIPTSQSVFHGAEVQVTLSTSVFDKSDPEFVPDATVKLYENHQLATEIPYDTTYHFYREPYSLQPGNHYKITVGRPDIGEVYGEFFFPEEVPINHAEWDTTTNQVHFSFTDPPGSDRYYFNLEVDFGSVGTGGLFQTSDPDISFFKTELFDSLLVFAPDDFDHLGYNGFLKDENYDGKEKTIDLLIKKPNEPGFEKIKAVTLILYHISPDLYEHYRTLSAYYSTKDNPFAEKVKIHGNIVNGFGAVGAATPSIIQAIKK